MLWLVDLLVVLLALAVLGLTGWSLFRHARVLVRALSRASKEIAAVAPEPPARRS